jgi:hypothetical protein
MRAPSLPLSLLALLCSSTGAAAEPAKPAPAAPAASGTIRIDAARNHVVNRFHPARALGAGIDRMHPAAVDFGYRPDTLKEVLAAGWQQVSYRLNTELHVEAWHWNPHGTWSDARGKRGYFTGASEPSAEPIRASYGHRLPHRGFTRNEGTEAHGFGRLTDGDPRSYWKSNPYLTRRYTDEDDAAFPQWLVIDLERTAPINAIKIAWGAPWAKSFDVQYFTGAEAMKHPTDGEWRTFPNGAVHDAKGGTATVLLAGTPIAVRFVRILLRDSSETCDSHGSDDLRNCLGFAVRELYLGTQERGHRFRDALVHSRDQKQSATFCSSVDPWHDDVDVNRDGIQTGLDLFYTSGVTRGQPAMIPVAVLYDTPENAAAELAYVEKRGYPISWVELGEEPDGQYMTPEHYAALYLQFATALHKVDPQLKLGGPAFTGQNEDILVWPDGHGSGSWLGRFLAYLKAHNRLGDFAFLSFEHYPFEPCKGSWADLYEEPRLISHIMDVWRADGLPPEVPMLVTEVNIAWQCDERFVDTWGGLWLADYIGAFLGAGGGESFFFHYLPERLSQECGPSWGAFAMLLSDEKFASPARPTAQWFAAQLLTTAWVQPGDGEHRVFRAESDVKDGAGHTLVTAYPLERPDGQWSVLLINKDEQQPHAVGLVFRDEAGKERGFSGPVALTRFGAPEFVWQRDAINGHANAGAALAHATLPAATATRITLPPASAVVVTGKR